MTAQGAGADADCVTPTGNDDGTSEANAYDSLADVRAVFSSLNGGDVIRLCRGGAFTSVSGNWLNYNAGPGNRIQIRGHSFSWASGDEPTQVKIRPPDIDTHGFNLQHGGTVKRDGFIEFIDLDLDASNFNPTGVEDTYGIYCDGECDEIYIENVRFDSWTIAIRAANYTTPGCSTSSPECNLQNDDWNIGTVQVLNSYQHGFLGVVYDSVLSGPGSVWDNNGQATFLDHHIYISHGANIEINGGVFTNAGTGGDSGTCYTPGIILHGGTTHDVTVRNIVMIEDASTANCWGIGFDAGYGHEKEEFSNLIVENSTFVNTGSKGVGFGSCSSGCIMRNNVWVNSQTDKGAIGFDASDGNGNFNDDADCTSAGYRDGSAQACCTGFQTGTCGDNSACTSAGWENQISTACCTGNGTGDCNDARSSGVVMQNNTCLFLDGSRGKCVEAGTTGTGSVATSNVMRYLSTTTTNAACWEFVASGLSEADNNYCSHPNANLDWTAGSADLSDWRSSTSFGDDSVGTGSTVPADPLFVNETFASYDLDLQASSPLIDAGHLTQSSSSDHDGTTRDATPDIGAYEYGAGGGPPADLPGFRGVTLSMVGIPEDVPLWH